MLTIKSLNHDIEQLEIVDDFIKYINDDISKIQLLFQSKTVKQLNLEKFDLEDLLYILEDNQFISKNNHPIVNKFLILMFYAFEAIQFKSSIKTLQPYLCLTEVNSQIDANIMFLNINNIRVDYNNKFSKIISLLNESSKNEELYINSIKTIIIYYITAIKSFSKINDNSLEESFKILFLNGQNEYEVLKNETIQNIVNRINIKLRFDEIIELLYAGKLYEHTFPKLQNFIIEDFLTKIYNDFTLEKDNWCNITSSQFSNSCYIDYDNKNYSQIYMEQYYLLRFASLYFYEYVREYKYFLENYHKSHLRILSIGVGAGLDYYGFKFAQKKMSRNIDIDYMGIDLQDWKYREKDIDFIQINLKDIEDNQDIMNFIQNGIDLIVFPKSLIEINKSILLAFSDLLIKNSTNNIWFLNSYIKKGNTISGIDEFNTIANNLQANNYKLTFEESTKIYQSFDKEKVSFLDYKNTWFKDIYNYCNSKCNNEQIEKCNLVNQHQMMNTNNLAMGLYKFER